MMLPGDKYEYFWTDKRDKDGFTGFNVLQFCYDGDYGKGGPGEWQSPTGAYNVKHLYGDNYDHVQATGVSSGNMYSALATHILRLADVYLIYAEAKIGTNGSTSDASAIDAFYSVRHRSVSSYERPSSITWEDVWKERRLELAGEGDRWYDYVRLAYYDADRAISELTSQRRNSYWNINALYKYYYESGKWDPSEAAKKEDSGEAGYDETTAAPNVTKESFTLPFPSEDTVYNPNLLEDPVDCDVRKEYAS